jgi:hypothetical protein
MYDAVHDVVFIVTGLSVTAAVVYAVVTGRTVLLSRYWILPPPSYVAHRTRMERGGGPKSSFLVRLNPRTGEYEYVKDFDKMTRWDRLRSTDLRGPYADYEGHTDPEENDVDVR